MRFLGQCRFILKKSLAAVAAAKLFLIFNIRKYKLRIYSDLIFLAESLTVLEKEP
jgi:hypothetical protein